MFLSRVEPSDDVDHDERIFECTNCAYSETVRTNSGSETVRRRPDQVSDR